MKKNIVAILFTFFVIGNKIFPINSMGIIQKNIAKINEEIIELQSQAAKNAEIQKIDKQIEPLKKQMVEATQKIVAKTPIPSLQIQLKTASEEDKIKLHQQITKEYKKIRSQVNNTMNPFIIKIENLQAKRTQKMKELKPTIKTKELELEESEKKLIPLKN